MPNRIIDADSDRNSRNVNISERIEQGNAVAEILKTMPWFVWAAPLWILAGLICLAIGHEGLNGFTSSVMSWLSLVPWVAGILCGIKAFTWVHNTYNKVRVDASNRRLLAASARKAEEAVLTVQYKNESLLADVDIRKQIPGLLAHLARSGVPFEYDAKGNLKVLSVPGIQVAQVPNQQGQIGAGAAGALPAPVGALPTSVRYEDVQDRIPAGHSLLGVSATSVETCEFGHLMTMWICGGSSTGKSNTVGIKIEEAVTNGRNLGILCIDYHARKSDSLYNKIRVYEDRFLMPVASTEEQALQVLQFFYTEFKRRRDIGDESAIMADMLLVVDEVPAVLESEDEEVVQLLKKIARICGRESRGFGMFGWFISQNAVGLAWLRNVVLTVIAHKMNMLNEAELACNQHKDIARDMENWPRGRVIVYGLSFTGVRVLQMPLFIGAAPVGDDRGQAGNDAGVVDGEQLEENSNPYPGEDNHMQEGQTTNVVPALSGDLRLVYDACQRLLQNRQAVSARSVAELIPGMKKDKANNLLNRLGDLGYIQRRKAI